MVDLNLLQALNPHKVLLLHFLHQSCLYVFRPPLPRHKGSISCFKEEPERSKHFNRKKFQGKGTSEIWFSTTLMCLTWNQVYGVSGGLSSYTWRTYMSAKLTNLWGVRAAMPSTSS
ncbi:unnamed protein product [Cuscuta epithymum]|uniref:Uncharacterized protein n=1 Tax=Cuscuta epithymum TaxID=186058 RepID=A0AAV0FUK0_9ASTE|nr:unnamed protein product [Cuscuta epithymum]